MVRIPIALVLAGALALAQDAVCQSAALDGGVAQQAYLKASNPGSNDQFGYQVAVSGDTVVVGAVFEDSIATGVNGDQSDNSAFASGAVYVFVRNGTSWSQQAYLKPSNTEKEDYFGDAVAVSGDTIVVGAWGEDSNATGVNGDESNNSAGYAGAVYVFVRNGTSWTQQAYLKASNTGGFDQFGRSVSISGDTVVVGAWLEDSSSTGVNGDQTNNGAQFAGAAYVFVRDGTSWSQQAYLKASNTGAFDEFGWSLSLSGDTLAVGAADEDSSATGVNGHQGLDSATDSGAAYVFVRSGATWSQQAYLKASNTGADDAFGYSVALSGDTVVVGAFQEDSDATGVDGDQFNNDANESGAAYVFVRTGTVWSQQAYLKSSNTDAADIFGDPVSVSGDVMVVAARHEGSHATGINGDQSDNSAGYAGAAYVFARSRKNWSQQAYLKASNNEAADLFGAAVTVSGDTAVIGAWAEDSNAIGVNGDQSINHLLSAGAAYLFDLGLNPWTDLGSGLAGSSGVPLLVGNGPLAPSSGNQLDLSRANPASPATLVFGLSVLGAPFKGGTLVPAPLLLVPLATNPSGALSLPFLWPSNVPPGTALYFQIWISDPAAVSGFAASNALEGVSS